jgi:DNA repair exonuclease SbcCD nuclease subunit
MKKENLGKITKLAMFTDIHWGARTNSSQHLEDCLNYIDWFIEKVREEKPSHIAFLGDWFENRNQVNVKTLNMSQEGARKLNDLGIPIIFIVGNHDLYHRQDRAIYSTDMFHDLDNFLLVSEPLELDKEWFVAPYMFRDEYPDLVSDINAHKYVLGHFEFRNFVVTGDTRLMEHGPDASDFADPTYIFSGHYHKRQVNKNIIYIGNTFPTNFGDAGDAARGCCFFDISNDEVYFHDWEDSPLFFKTRLTRVIGGESDFPAKARVRCVLDMDIGYSDVQTLRDEMIKGMNLREFSVEEDMAARKGMIAEGLDIEGDLDLSSLDNTVRQLITEGVSSSPTIDPSVLIHLYEEL